MKQSKISLAVAAAMIVGGAGIGASAADRISGARVSEPSDAPMVATTGDRYVVKYRSGGPGTDVRAQTAALQGALGRAGLDRPLRATAASASKAPVAAQIKRRMGVDGWAVVTTSRALSASEAASFLRELSADPAVVSAEPDLIYRHMGDVGPAAAPNDPNYAQYQWNFYNPTGGVRAEEAWEISTGEGVLVAVLDTGIVEGTLDLAANVVPGYDMLSDKRISRRETDDRVPGGWDLGDWIEENYCTGWATNDPHPADISSWHGSHVAGTIAQETNNGTGLAGIAHGAKVMPIRVLGSCGGFSSDIADGMLWAAGIEVEGLPVNENPAEILNMSLGSSGQATCPALYQDAIDQVNAAGSIIVVAAGNSNGNAANYTMSACDDVISIGATRITGGKASYSNYGERVDLSAPGGGGGADGNPNGYVWQVTNGGEQGPEEGNWILRGMGGTSMASPHVAAAAAMVQSVVETPLDWQEMRDLLTSTARPFPVSIPSSTPMGAGILDLKALLDKATEEPCDPAVEECGPTATPLGNKVPVRGLSGGAGGEVLYSIEVPAGVVGPLSITTSGGSGDVSLYVSFDAEPTADAADFRSARPGNNEAVRVASPQAGVYYVKLVGVRAYSNVTLQARHN
ncbi:S8 family serine peptidase [Luteimonas huabeiensis]|uniref:S8 family serine peptidase n=1 Tax=Luteimonas huabeiensis TaxID=1244513 RepID=UPI000466E166|nr:S8 family serine peptidase [Luteimonas huabeiensis]